eukprot:909540-Amphidinium_carterae.1
MATIVTRATPSGSRAEGGALDIPTALQAFTAIRLAYSPKEYKQLFNTATVATAYRLVCVMACTPLV